MIFRFEPATETNRPPLLALHGTGGDENDLIPLAQAISPGSAILSLRGDVLENGAARFFRRLAEGVFDQQDLEYRTAELASFVEKTAAENGLSGKDLVAVGFSNGANIASSLLLRRPDLLHSAILIRAMTPFEPEQPTHLAGKRVLLLSGIADPIVPKPNVERLAAILRESGANVDHRWMNSGHGITNGDLSAARSFLGG